MPLPEPARQELQRQHGLASRTQLLTWMSSDAIQSYVRRRRLIPVERGIYRSGECPPLPVHAPLAAALRVGVGAQITGPFALAVRGVDGLTWSDPWEILVAPQRRVRGVGFPHRRNPTPEVVVDPADGLPVAPAVVALVDSGRDIGRIGRRRLRLALDSSRWRGLVTTAELRRRVRQLGPTDAGARIFAEWDDRGELEPESDGERSLGRLVTRIAPPPVPQHRVAGFRIDWYWQRYGFGYEYHGVTDHRSALDRLADTERAHMLLRHGIELHTVISDDLHDADAFLRRTMRLLTARADELGAPPPQLVTR